MRWYPSSDRRSYKYFNPGKQFDADVWWVQGMHARSWRWEVRYNDQNLETWFGYQETAEGAMAIAEKYFPV